MNELTRNEIFGKETKPTIYYIVGYRAKINQFKPHIKFLKLAGFRIVAFEINPTVLSAGDPSLLGKALDEVMDVVQLDMKNHKIAGAFGTSLGTFFALNILALEQVEKAFLATGGGSIVRAVWDMPALSSEKSAYEKKGHNKEELSKYWNPIDISQNVSKIAGKRVAAVASKADQYIPFDDIAELRSEWLRFGVRVQLRVYKRLSHMQLIVITLLRLGKTVRFFGSNST